MKKLFLILFSLGLTIGASAQKYYHGGYHYYSHPRVIVSGGAFVPFYPFGFGYPYLGYPYGMPPYNYGSRPTRLDMQIEDIKRDYSYKIYSARQDKTLSHSERKETIRELKHERDDAIDNAKSSYYKTK